MVAMESTTPSFNRRGATMLRKILSVSLVLILAMGGITLAAGTAQARPRGGAHVGGFHAGGARIGGGAPIGGFHSSFRPTARPTFRAARPTFRAARPTFRPAIRSRSFVPHVAYPRYRNYGGYYYPGYYGYYGSAPSYDNYPYTTYSGVGDSLSTDVGGYGDDFAPSYSQAAESSSATSVPETPPEPARADISVTLPADATLWAMGHKTSPTGSVRHFVSPPLKAGSNYVYDFRASWKENGHTVTQNQTVRVASGAHVDVHFPVPAAKSDATANR
jgi:uncharacterized protein (TIGR03000 family)